METFCSIPTDYAATMIETIFNTGPGKKVTFQDGRHEWELGVDVDEDTGVEMFQITVKDLLVVVEGAR